MAKFHDFDKYVKERNKERSVTFRLFGETYYLPPTIPFDAALLLQSLAGRDKDEKLPDSFVIDLFVRIVGKDIYESLVKNPQFDVDLMTQVMSWILQEYGLTGAKDTPDPKESQ